MLSLEQVRLLDEKVARTVEYVGRLSAENAALRKKLDATQKRIDELEVFVSLFKEEQGRIEDGILSALDRLSQFENVIEKSLAGRTKPAPAIHDKPGNTSGDGDTANLKETGGEAEKPLESVIPENSGGQMPEGESSPDIQDPLEYDDEDSGEEADSEPSDNGELDIF
jgi:hypothetical protein